MSQLPVLCIPIDEEIELRLHEEQYAEEYFALIERNHAYLREWMSWAADAGSLAETKAYMKQTLLQFANKEELQLGIWYQNRLVGCIGYPHLDWANRKVEIGYWIDASMQGKGLVTKVCRALVPMPLTSITSIKWKFSVLQAIRAAELSQSGWGSLKRGSFDKVRGSMTTTTIWWSMECLLVNGADRQRLFGVVAKFREKGGQGIAAGEELNICAGEFKVFFTHVPTSAFKEFFIQVVGLLWNASLALWLAVVKESNIW